MPTELRRPRPPRPRRARVSPQPPPARPPRRRRQPRGRHRPPSRGPAGHPASRTAWARRTACRSRPRPPRPTRYRWAALPERPCPWAALPERPHPWAALPEQPCSRGDDRAEKHAPDRRLHVGGDAHVDLTAHQLGGLAHHHHRPVLEEPHALSWLSSLPADREAHDLARHDNRTEAVGQPIQVEAGDALKLG